MKDFFERMAILAIVLVVLLPAIGLIWFLVDNNRKAGDTTLQLEMIAATWDGSKEAPDVDNTKDAWGEPIFAEVVTGPFNNELRLWDSHRVIVRVKRRHGINYVAKGIESASEAAAKGMTRGAIQGIKEGFKK